MAPNFDNEADFSSADAVFSRLAGVPKALDRFCRSKAQMCNQLGLQSDDLLQATYLKLGRSRSFLQLPEVEQVRYALKTARNLLIDISRHVKADMRGGSQVHESLDNHDPAEPDKHSIVDAAAVKKLILEVLTPKATEVLLDRYLEGRSNDDIASKFDMSLSAVSSSLSKSLSILRNCENAAVTEQLRELLAA